MSDPEGFITKSAQWKRPHFPPWTSHINEDGSCGDGFNVYFDDDPPLQFDRFIGEGNNGTVNAMKCEKNEELVAVKRIRIDMVRDSMVALQNEVRSLQQLSHYHVLDIVGTYIHGDYFFLMTLPVAQCSLYSYLRHATKYPPHKLIDQCGRPDEILPTLFGCLANGLRYIHREKMRHMDIKPDNIILINGRCLFADFGIARKFATRSTSDTPVSRTHKVRPVSKAFVDVVVCLSGNSMPHLKLRETIITTELLICFRLVWYLPKYLQYTEATLTATSEHSFRATTTHVYLRYSRNSEISPPISGVTYKFWSS